MAGPKRKLSKQSRFKPFPLIRKAIANRLYNTIEPDVYGDVEIVKQKAQDFIAGTPRKSTQDQYSEDAWAKYLGLEQPGGSITESQYRPSVAKGKRGKYHRLPDEFERALLQGYQQNRSYLRTQSDDPRKIPMGENMLPGTAGRVLGNFTVGEGEDEQGKYISYYDKYDLAPSTGEGSIKAEKIFGDPFEFYNRIYYGKPGQFSAPAGEVGKLLKNNDMTEQFAKGGRYNLAKTFKKMAKKRSAKKHALGGYVEYGDIQEYSAGGIIGSTAAGALGGAAVFPPFGAIIGGGIGLLKGIIGHKREKQQEAAEAEALAAQKAQQDALVAEQEAEETRIREGENRAYRTTMGQASNVYGATFPDGGTVEDPNAELEKGEVYRTPDGHIYKVSDSAKSHKQGGEDYRLPPGTEILGKDKLCCGKTAKEVGSEMYREHRKHMGVLEGRPTSTERETSERMLAKIDDRFSKVMNKQENQKAVRTTGQYARGGKVIPKYQTTGTVGYPFLNAPVQGQGIQMPQYQYSGSGINPYGPGVGVQPGGPGVGVSGEGILNVPQLGGGFGGLGGGAQGGGAGRDWFPNQGTGLAYGIGQALSLGSGIFNLIQGSRKPDTLDPALFRGKPATAPVRNRFGTSALSMMGRRRVDINPYLEANRLASATGARNLRQAGNISQAAYTANLGGLAGQRMRADQQARQFQTQQQAGFLKDEATMAAALGEGEAGRLQRQDLFNAQLGMQNRQMDFRTAQSNLQSMAAQRGYLGQGFRDIGMAGQMFARNMMQRDRDRMLANVMPEYWQNFQWDPTQGFSFKG
jgi:hypothetical protein